MKEHVSSKLKMGLIGVVLAAFLGGMNVQANETEVAEKTTQQQTVNEKGISINQASVEELVTALNGIGTKKAEAIINYRERYGEFSSIDQLQEVPGIGPALIERNRTLLKL